MGLNFRKSISVGKGVRVNLSKGGPSISFGKKGLRQTISTSGKSTTTVGIPGTGIYYSKRTNLSKGIGGLFGIGNKSSKGSRSTKAQTNAEQKKLQKEQLLSQSQAKLDEYNEYLKSIISVHRICDDTIDWEAMSIGNLPSNVKPGSPEYKEISNLKQFAIKVIEGDVDTYLEVIDQMRPFDDLVEYGADFEVGTDDPDELSVEFRVKSDEVVPNYSLSILASGELSEKPMAKGAHNELVQDYVCSTVIRIARDTFALLPVRVCRIHAVDKVVNVATGNEEEITILSCAISKDDLMSINMDRIDPSAALEALGCNMSFKKTTGFGSVERV